MKKFFLSVFVSVFLFFPLTHLLAQETPDTNSAEEDNNEKPDKKALEELNLEEAKKALSFGIDSAVINVIDQASNNKDQRLKKEIFNQFNSLNDTVVVSVLNYAKALEDYSLSSEILDKLYYYQDNSSALNVQMLKFLKASDYKLSEEDIENLLDLLESPEKSIQAALIECLAEKASSKQADVLIAKFHKSSIMEVQLAIISALAKLKTDEGLQLLQEIAENDDEERTLRNAALVSLGTLGDKDSLSIIKKFLIDQDVYKRSAAIQALAGFPLDSVKALYQQALRDAYWRNRVGVLKVVGEKKITDFSEAIIYMSENDPEQPVRFEALRCLASFKSEKAFEALRKQLEKDKTSTTTKALLVELLIKDDFQSSKNLILQQCQKDLDSSQTLILNAVARQISQLKQSGLEGFIDLFLNNKNPGIVISGIRAIENNDLKQYADTLEELAKKGGAIKSSAENALKKIK